MTGERHALAKLPEIQTTDSEPGLLAANLVRIQVCYPCQCGVVVRSSETIPRSALEDVTVFSDKVRQITSRSLDLWEEHQRG